MNSFKLKKFLKRFFKEMGKESFFYFKKFKVSHASSSMKIGVDGVLVGAWAGERLRSLRNIIDVGTGCGVIALMMAQRFPSAHIKAIDIDQASINEAETNFKNSPWPDNLKAERIDFNEILKSETKYDLIVSNPPFFNAGMQNPETSRLIARHQAGLSPEVLLRKAPDILSPDGRLAFILPFQEEVQLNHALNDSKLILERRCVIKGNENKPPKRVMLEFRMQQDDNSSDNIDSDIFEEELCIEHSPGVFTEEYIALTKDFYLHF